MKVCFKEVFLKSLYVFLGVVLCQAVNAADERPVVKVELTTTNYVALEGEVNPLSINNVMQGITNSDPSKPFYIYLDSPGGSVFAGRKLVNYLQTTDRNIVCIAHTAISMAFVIYQTCQTRLITDHGILMSHQIASGTQGTLNDMKAAVGFVQKLADMYETLIADRLGLTLEAYRAKINPEWWFVGAKEAIDSKAADVEAAVSCSKELEKSSRTFGEGQNQVTVSSCPVA